MKKQPADTIHATDLAALCGIDETRLARLAARGELPKARLAVYPRTETLRALFKFLRGEIDKAEAESLSWTINGLFNRTAIDRRSWVAWLRDTKPTVVDGEERYPLRAIIDAIRANTTEETKDLERERARLTGAQADLAEMDRAVRRKELMEIETVFRVWENVALSIRRVVLVSGLPTRDQDTILAELKNATLAAMEEQAEFKKNAEEQT